MFNRRQGGGVRVGRSAVMAAVITMLPVTYSLCWAVAQENPGGTRDKAGDSAIEVTEETWPNGLPRRRTEGRRGPNGELIRHGLSMIWYESGQLKLKTEWVDGVRHGKDTRWYLHGAIWSEGHYLEGLEDGKWTRWHQSTGKHSEWTMRRGAWVGRYTQWHENGKKRLEVVFVNGLRQGPQKMWDEQGVLASTIHFVDSVEQP